MGELKRRAEVLQADNALRARLIAVFESTGETRQAAAYVEERIYDGFIKSGDEARMEVFHNAPWEDRPGMVNQFDDPRLIELGRRLIYIERPDVLNDAQRRSGARSIAKRLAGQTDGVPWLTFSRALAEIEALLAAAVEDAERQILEELRAHLDDRRQRARALLYQRT